MSFNDEWEREAGAWIAWARSSHDAYWLYRDAFFELVPAPGRSTLEIGCGEGRVVRDLSTRGHHVVGIDSSPALIAAAREADPSGEYLLGTATSLPFEDGSFDLAIAYNSLMDIEEMPLAISEAARVLEPRGRFCVCVTHPLSEAGAFSSGEGDAPFFIADSYYTRRRREASFEVDGMRMTFRGWIYPLEDYTRAFERAGFLIEAIREPMIPETTVLENASMRRWRRIPNFLMLRLVRDDPSA